MPTVRCPSCQRALKLPEAHMGGEVRCPLCQTTFPAPSTEAPLTLALRPGGEVETPAEPSRSLEPEEPAGESPLPSKKRSRKPAPIEALPRDSRESLQAAARSLKRFAALGAGYLFTCGCVNEKVLGEMIGFDWTAEMLVVVLLLRLVILGVVYSGAAALGRCRAPELARTAAILALLMSAYVLLWPLLVVIDLVRSGWGGSPTGAALGVVSACVGGWVVSLVLALVVAGIGIRGGLRALLLLNKPEVLRAFRGQY